ncbi:hypothetical protein FHX57_004253 [Paraburkholderia tropica]|nr:hypothetical protein [Paraburkholderia tropica]MBB3001895.1 hypothetical protein [Paraburkholderia tropica]MBB6321278.1 hypothetical protein [Paraburkholderia tropica]
MSGKLAAETRNVQTMSDAELMAILQESQAERRRTAGV